MPTRHDKPFDPVSSASGFVGREDEMDTIITLLSRHRRLITLLGPGGIGKTRLAAESIERLRRTRQLSAAWVRLDRLDRGCGVTAVEEEAARSVLTTDYSGRSARHALIENLTGPGGRERPTILVMDNCEHILAEAAQVIADLLDAVPRLSIVATSREPIGWIDEQMVAVPPLSRREAVSLFRQRAEMTGHPVTSSKQIAMAAQICAHMGNNPLYVRLAAGRLIQQPLARILEQASAADERRLALSHRATLGVEARHHAINDVIAWSYDLCTDAERLLFDRMSVFAAGHDSNPQDADTAKPEVGADLEAIREICADPDAGPIEDGKLPRDRIEGLLDRLADRSLISRHLTVTTVRYSLLENLRVFAHQRLVERSTDSVDEPARLAERHLHYYRNKVIFAEKNYFGPAERDLSDWARASWSNIRAAFERSMTTPGKSVVGLEMCVGLLTLRQPFFGESSWEIRQWTERALAASRSYSPQPTRLQISALALLVWRTLSLGRIEDAEQMLDDCIELCLPDAGTRRNWRESPDIDLGLPAAAELAWGIELLMARHDPAAITVLLRAREKFDRLGAHGPSEMSEVWAALSAAVLGTAAQAHEVSIRYLQRATSSGGSWLLSWAQLARSLALTKYGDPTEAMRLQRIALHHQVETRDHWGGLWAVEFRAWSLAQMIQSMLSQGNADRRRLTALAVETAHILGGTRTMRSKMGVDINRLGPFGTEAARATEIARKVLGEKQFDAAEAQGAALRPEYDEVYKLALGTLSQVDTRRPAAPAAHASAWSTLTAAEREVALLAAAGGTNSEIAARRGKSRRTVDAQMSAIFQKLQISDRNEIADFVPKDELQAAQARRRTHR